MLVRAVRALDRVLRGEATSPAALAEGKFDVPGLSLAAVTVLCAMFHGACVGSFALFREGGPIWPQFLASVVKLPALYALTLVVTAPSLYVFNALVGSRLDLPTLLRLVIASMGVNLAVLASLGPIVAFFSLSTTSYPFMVLLNVLVAGVAGILGLMFLVQTLQRLTDTVAPRREPVRATAPPKPPIPDDALAEAAPPPAAEVLSQPSALDPLAGQVLGRHVRTVFRCWMVIFGLVGAQMSWVLRPFIGNPDEPFRWIRGRESNFFQAVWETLLQFVPRF